MLQEFTNMPTYNLYNLLKEELGNGSNTRPSGKGIINED